MCYSNPSKERFQFNFLKTLRADGTIKTFWSDLLHRVFTQSLPSRSPEHTETNTPFWKAWYLNLHLKNLLLLPVHTSIITSHSKAQLRSPVLSLPPPANDFYLFSAAQCFGIPYLGAMRELDTSEVVAFLPPRNMQAIACIHEGL